MGRLGTDMVQTRINTDQKYTIATRLDFTKAVKEIGGVGRGKEQIQ